MTKRTSRMTRAGLTKAGLAAVAVATVGAGVVGGAAIASASDDGGAVSAHRYGGEGPGQPGGPTGDHGPGGFGGPMGGPMAGTEVTGDALTELTAAVSAYDAELTVDRAFQTGDGTYVVLATTKDGGHQALTVSKDLATVTKLDGPSMGDHGPGAFGGPMAGTEVTGDALTELTAAVSAYDAELTVDHAFQKDDGTYVVLATTKDDGHQALTVSKDLATVTELDGPPMGDHGPGGPMGGFGRPDGLGPGGPGTRSGGTESESKSS